MENKKDKEVMSMEDKKEAKCMKTYADVACMDTGVKKTMCIEREKWKPPVRTHVLSLQWILE